MIPFSKPMLGKEEFKAVEEVLKSGWLVHGPKNEEFEEKFADYIGTKYAVSLNSCTSCLQLALEALNIKGEVIVPSFTFVASANAIVRAGAQPVFADIRYDTCNIDPEKIEDLISPRTEAIMPVHFAGQSCQMQEILQIAKKHRLALIEDSAETLGGEYKGKKTGSFGIGCFSFFPTKNITTGEGGMLTTNDKFVAEKVRALSSHGISRTTHSREKLKKFWYRAAVFAGFNYRLTNFQAAIGIEQLKKVERMNNLRIKIAQTYSKLFKNNNKIVLPLSLPGIKHVWQVYTIKVRGMDRNKFVAKLRDKGIGVSVHFDPPVHQQPFYYNKKFKKGDLSVTDLVSRSIVTIPLYPGMPQKDIFTVAEAINKATR